MASQKVANCPTTAALHCILRQDLRALHLTIFA